MGQVEVLPLRHGFAAVYEGGADEVALVRRRIAKRQAERDRQARAEATHTRRAALARSNARPGRRGGAA